MEVKLRETVVAEYLAGGATLRELSRRHGLSVSKVHRWVKRQRRSESEEKTAIKRVERSLRKDPGQMPVEVEKLQRELEEARLYARLLNTMIDIAEDEMGIDIRKKHGARRS